MNKFVLIGGGNMGREIAKLLVLSKGYKNVMTVECDDSRRGALPFRTCSKINQADFTPNTCTILCTKPQDLPSVVAEFAKYKTPGAPYGGAPPYGGPYPLNLISILAGVSTTNLKRAFPFSNISRAMPNLALSKGCSDTVFYSEKEDLADLTEEIFSLGGKPIRVAEDSHVDIATTIIGSGPAYYLKMLEAMSEEAQTQGVPKILAEEFAEGALSAANAVRKKNAAQLIKRISSKGGTTAAATEILDRYTFSKIINSALRGSLARVNEIDFAAGEKIKQQRALKRIDRE